MKPVLSIDTLKEAALYFCKEYSPISRKELFGVTDGKAIGTFVEHLFQIYLKDRFHIEAGNSAKGLDLPLLNTDIKVTSLRHPQSSCPFKDSKQKIFGLGYNLLIFVYQKSDDNDRMEGVLDFVSCSFIDQSRTGDYQTTTGLLNIIRNNGNRDDLFAFLEEHNIPGDEVSLYNLAAEILESPPKVGYLSISNALQWRLQYARVLNMSEEVDGIYTIVRLKE